MFDKVPQQKGCRYFLKVGVRTSFNRGFRTRQEVSEWVEERIKEHGLMWRIGFVVKLRGGVEMFEIVDKRGERLKA